MKIFGFTQSDRFKLDLFIKTLKIEKFSYTLYREIDKNHKPRLLFFFAKDLEPKNWILMFLRVYRTNPESGVKKVFHHFYFDKNQEVVPLTELDISHLPDERIFASP